MEYWEAIIFTEFLTNGFFACRSSDNFGGVYKKEQGGEQQVRSKSKPNK